MRGALSHTRAPHKAVATPNVVGIATRHHGPVGASEGPRLGGGRPAHQPPSIAGRHPHSAPDGALIPEPHRRGPEDPRDCI